MEITHHIKVIIRPLWKNRFYMEQYKHAKQKIVGRIMEEAEVPNCIIKFCSPDIQRLRGLRADEVVVDPSVDISADLEEQINVMRIWK